MHTLYRLLSYGAPDTNSLAKRIFGPFVALAAFVLSLIFVPYMLHILYKEKKYGWILFFLPFVLVPTLAAYLPLKSEYFTLLNNIVVFPFILFYCNILRMEMQDWIREKTAREYWNLQIAKKKEEEKLLNSGW